MYFCVNTDCGMATDCALIGSFNNHPKWQTIGWIKYTCWLNYRCNIFTPTCTVFTNTYTHRSPHTHSLHLFQMYEFVGFLWSFLSKSSTRLIWAWGKKDEETMSHTRTAVSTSTKLIVVALSSQCSNWRSGINCWSILFSSVNMYLCEQVLLSFQSNQTMYWIFFGGACVCGSESEASSSLTFLPLSLSFSYRKCTHNVHSTYLLKTHIQNIICLELILSWK